MLRHSYPRPYSQVQPLNASFKVAELDEGCCPLKWPSVAEALAAARATAIFLAASRCVVDAVSLLHMFSTLACTLHARFVVLQANLRCGWDLGLTDILAVASIELEMARWILVLPHKWDSPAKSVRRRM